jgi:hypothetical protein
MALEEIVRYGTGAPENPADDIGLASLIPQAGNEYRSIAFRAAGG